MSIYIKNTDIIDRSWLGKTVLVNEYYLIKEIEKKKWSTNSQLLIDIGNGKATIAKSSSGLQDITDVNDAINYLKDDEPKQVDVNTIPKASPFADKYVEGKSIYARIHGQVVSATSGANTIDFSVPFPAVKISGVELIGGEVGDTVDMLILDDATGTYSTVPHYQFNQYGFGVAVAKDYYKREHNYDADLYYGMIVRVNYNSASAKTIAINYILHELK